MTRRFIISILVSVAMSSAQAAVTVVRTVENQGLGIFGASKKQVTTWIAGDKHRQELKGEGKPSMMERLSGAGRPVITRLDKKVVWTLNAPKKSYEEAPLAAAPVSASNEPADDSARSDGPDEKPTSRISKAEFKVTPMKQKKTFGAYVCDGYQVKALIETEDLETKAKAEMQMIQTLWNAPDTGAVAQLKKEEADYAKAYANALGMTEGVRQDLAAIGTALIAAMAGAGKKELSGALAKMPAELKKIKGYPIHTRVEWYQRGGEDDAAASDGDPEDSAEMPGSVSDALGGFAAGLVKKKIAAKKAAPTENGRLVLAMTTEVTSISTAAIPAETFEVPAGFKKAKK